MIRHDCQQFMYCEESSAHRYGLCVSLIIGSYIYKNKNIFEKMSGYVGFLPPPTYFLHTLPYLACHANFGPAKILVRGTDFFSVYLKKLFRTWNIVPGLHSCARVRINTTTGTAKATLHH